MSDKPFQLSLMFVPKPELSLQTLDWGGNAFQGQTL